METYTVQTIAEIQAELNTEANSKIDNLSASSAAEWKIWTYIMAVSIRIMQVITASFQAIINQTLATKRFGTRGWLGQIGLSFQLGNTLTVDSKGNIGYASDLADSKIIKAISVIEQNDGTVDIKVAKLADTALAQLTADELLQFKNYMEAQKPAGMRIGYVSLPADQLQYTVTVYHDMKYAASAIQTAITAAITAYKDYVASVSNFDGTVYKQAFINHLMEVEGVITVKLTLFKGKASTDPAFADITDKYVTAAGYFNYDTDNCTLTVSPITALV